MHFRKSLLLAALAGGASALPAAAATRLVPQQYPTIQKAVNAARPGDTVQITAKPRGGVYNEAVTIATPGLTLQGVNNPVLDGTGVPGVTVSPFPGYSYTVYLDEIAIRAAHVAVRGLTVQNGAAAGISAGIQSADNSTEVGFSDVEVSGCVVRANQEGVMLDGFSGPLYNQGPDTYLTGIKFLNNTVTGNAGVGALVAGSGAVASGNTLTGNGTVLYGAYGDDGLDVSGDGLTVTGNTLSGNAAPGNGTALTVTAPTYNPASPTYNPAGPGTPAAPIPAPTAVTLNAVHDNPGEGVSLAGTMTVSGNVVDRSTGHGLVLNAADYSVVTGNSVTRTVSTEYQLQDSVGDDGVGIYVQTSGYSQGPTGFVPGGPLTLALNRVSGNGGDGLVLFYAAGVRVTGNAVTGNGQVGIHVSSFVHDAVATPALPGNTVSYNYARQNALFDAQDDTTGHHSYNQEGQASTPNVWTRNDFGTTDPTGLSR